MTSFCGADDRAAASVVLCTFQGRHRIDLALAALRKQDLEEPFEVIAVISGNDGCAQFVASAHPDVRVISSTARVYPGRARNLGVRAARAPVIAFVPDDGVTAPGWLSARLRHHRSEVPLVAGAISNGTPSSIVGTADYYAEYAASMPVLGVLERQPIPHTLSYAKHVFERAGTFPELEVPGEDTLFNQRCMALGIGYACEPAAVMSHRGPTSLRPYLAHQVEHGRGLARCILTGTIDDQFRGDAGSLRLAVSTLVGYPIRRWWRTFALVRCAGSAHTARFVLLAPLVLAGYVAGGWGSWCELRSLGAPRPSVQ